jgi:hypothetical protein
VSQNAYPTIPASHCPGTRVGDAHGTGTKDLSDRRARKYERRVDAILQAGIDWGVPRGRPVADARAWLGMHNYTYLRFKAGGRVSARGVAKPWAAIFSQGIARSRP